MKLASICYRALKLLGVTALAQRLSRGGVVLCYHNVVADSGADPHDDLGLHMPLSTFQRQMRWLANNYDVVPLRDLVGRVSQGESLRGVAAVTFDDGYGGVFDHALPVLRDLSIPATVFIVAEAPERDERFWWDDPEVLRAYSPDQHRHWLTTLRGDSATILESFAPARLRSLQQTSTARRPAPWQTITAAAKSGGGVRLGVHSASHRSLPTLDALELRREVLESRDIIKRRTGETAEFFAYPYGLWNERVREAVRSAGYRAAFTLERGHGSATDPWALPRMNVPAGIGYAAFQAWTAGLHP